MEVIGSSENSVGYLHSVIVTMSLLGLHYNLKSHIFENNFSTISQVLLANYIYVMYIPV
jgi:hypothetical protein